MGDSAYSGQREILRVRTSQALDFTQNARAIVTKIF